MTHSLNDLYELPAPPTTAERVAAGELEVSEDYNTYPAPGQHSAVAERLNTEVFSTGGGESTICFWQGQWWLYTGTHWQAVEEEEVRKAVWNRLDKVTYKKTTGKGEPEHHPWLPSKAKVTNVLEPLKLANFIPRTTTAPTWLGDGDAPGASLMAMGNGLLDLD